MRFIVKKKPPDIMIGIVIGSTAFVVVLGIVIQQLRRLRLAKKDAIAALARARKAYGFLNLEPTATSTSINSGDLVGLTANPAFVGFEAMRHKGKSIFWKKWPPPKFRKLIKIVKL